MRERDLKVVNTSDADIVAAFSAPATTAVVTWKPQLSAVLATPDAQLVFDSSKIPGEILDFMVVKTDVLKANPKLGKALVGAWYETVTLMFKNDAAARARAGGDGQGLRHRPCGVRGAIGNHARVRDAAGSLRVHDG